MSAVDIFVVFATSAIGVTMCGVLYEVARLATRQSRG